MQKTSSLVNRSYQTLCILFMRTRWQSFFVVCFIAFTLVIGIAPTVSSQMPTPGKTNIIVGGEIGYPPYSFLDKNGEPTGFQVELTRAIAKTMGMNIEIRLTPWPETRRALENGSIDIIPGMFYSEERAKIFDFSPPFAIVSVAIFARVNSPSVKSIEDLRDKEIIVMRGEAMHDYILKHRLTDRILLAETPADALRLLASGKGDYALVAQMPGFYWIKELKLSNITSVGPSLEPFKNCFAVRKGNKLLLSRFTEGLNILNQTGEYQKLYEKSLGVLEPTRITPGLIVKYAAIVIVPLILLLAFSFLWTLMLRSKVNQKTKELRESELKFRTIFESFEDIYYETDVSGNITLLSPSVYRISGWKPEELIGRPATLVYTTPEDRSVLMKAIFSSGYVRDYELNLVMRDGSKVAASLAAHLIYDSSGALTGMAGSLRNITERKKVEEKLKQQSGAMEIAIEGIAILDATGEYVYLNKAHANVYGYNNAGELIGKSWSILYDSNELQRFEQKILPELHQKKNWHGEAIGKKADGRKFPQELSLTALDSGGLVCVVRDITARKQAEEERKNMEAQLFQSQKMEAIGTLAGGIAHDFNNILSVIIGYTELARDKNQKENKEQYLQNILKGAERAKNLVKQILTFSRQDGNEKKPLDIKVLLKEAIKFLRASIPTTIAIDQYITDESCNIMADPTQMHQIIMNLCTNAAHAMKEAGGTLRIELANIELVKDEIPNFPDLEPGHYVKLTISDTGHGIDPVLIKSIFDPFFTTKSVDEGTGLGLSVVYGIVKSHGGVINVNSEQGKGAAFHIYLPLIIQTETKEMDAGKPVIGGTERILFVDDEPSLVDIGMRMLTSLGYHTTAAVSSVEALNIFSADPQLFDLVITDMTLPKMTGTDLSREMLKIQPDIPIILCSGIKEPETEARAKSLGIKAYLTKPLTRKELARVIREVLGEKAED